MARTDRAVVIGSGAGGLTAAAWLAKQGFDVLVLEQAAQLGGHLAPFERGGYRFAPGVHLIGECRPGQLVHRLLGGLGIDAERLFCELDPAGFDVHRFPGLEVRVCAGLERYRERLTIQFPLERAGVHRFFEVVEAFRRVTGAIEDLSAGAPHWRDLRALGALPSVARWWAHTLGELIDDSVDDDRVRAALGAPSGAIGLPPSRAAASAALSAVAHYIDGAFFPRGGAGALRDALVRAGESAGARYRTGARVDQILVRDRRALGVILPGGEYIEADVVVSNADPVLTFGRMIHRAALPRELVDRIATIEPSLAPFAIHLGMRRDLRAHGLGAFNVWDHPTLDIEASYQGLFDGQLPAAPAFYLSPTSLKDDTGSLAPAGGSSLEIVTWVPYERYERFADLAFGARGPEYDAEKHRTETWLLDAVDERWPGLIGDVDVREVSTPLTFESYTMSVRGGAYGPAHIVDQTGFRRFRTTTPIQNLFLAGAGVFHGGVAPCLLSGRVAASEAARASIKGRGRALRVDAEAHAPR